MSLERDLEWEGCFNVRDLGGFATRDGGVTRRGVIVRADALDRLTRVGWASLVGDGVRTVVDLRNDDELREDAASRPADLATVRVPLDDLDDEDLWQQIRDNELDGTPLYFRLFLERKPHRCAAALKAIAHAEPGGVVFHCGRGRDRTGLITLLLLAIVGVAPEDTLSDYELSTERVRRLDAALGEQDQGEQIAAVLERKHVTARATILDLFNSVDIQERLREAGLNDDDLDALRRRLVISD